MGMIVVTLVRVIVFGLLMVMMLVLVKVFCEGGIVVTFFLALRLLFLAYSWPGGPALTI